MFRTALLRSTLAVVFGLLTACSLLTPLAPEPQPLPSPAAAWTIKLDQSGGFAGVQLSVEVTSDGRLTAQDQRSGRSVVEDLPPEKVVALLRMYSTTRVTTPQAPHGGCADCFFYDLSMISGGQQTQVALDDTDLADSGAADLVKYLQDLRDSALRSAP
jgi:hypothetical protein